MEPTKNLTLKEAMGLNRKQRRALASYNKTGKIPSIKNISPKDLKKLK